MIQTQPTLTGEHGRAWLIPRSELHALVAMWVIEAPWAHPLWHSYILSLVHLRPDPGLAAPVVRREGATHELVLYALDAATNRGPMIEGGPILVLEPPNFAAQMIEAHDAAAFENAERAVMMILSRTLSPDTDHISSWIELFGDSMVLN
jgi:hypothetical protein